MLQCFCCTQNTGKREIICKNCNIWAHKNCMSLYTFQCSEYYKSEYKPYCPICNILLDTYNINYDVITRDMFIAKLKKLIAQHEFYFHDAKEENMEEIFDIIVYSKNKLLDKNKGFKNQVKTKLLEFYQNGTWVKSEKYYKLLFDKNIKDYLPKNLV